MSEQRFEAVVGEGAKRRVFIPLPFVPDDLWGTKIEHHVSGSVDAMPVRAVVERFGDEFGIVLGPAWRRDCGVGPGDQVAVVLAPEGPQRDGLASDICAALEARPEAAAFFDGIAQFYRKAYLRYIDATKRHPEERIARIDEVVGLLARGIKQRPVPGE